MHARLLDTMFDCHPREEQKKAEFLDFLYEQSGRDSLPHDHPLHMTYTGLWQEYTQRCAEEARDAWWDVRQIDAEAFDR
jgi:capsid portal protein